MGSMINIFEITVGMAKSKQLTERPHCDAVSPNPIQRNQLDVVKKKTMDKFGSPRYEKTINKSCNLWKSLSKKSIETPLKMLIAQEMLRERESKQSPSSVVAKLMGLDALPNDEQFDMKACAHEDEYTDVYEVGHQNRGHDENPTEKRMALVRQKFAEAKHLASDENLLQSKEFLEALEVLRSNRDLFLKFLEGPNSLLSNRLRELQTISPSSEARHITLLKPLKTIEPEDEVKERKHQQSSAEDIDRDMNMNQRSSRSSSFVHHWAENISQPTRIVVLKPNPTKFTSSELLESRDFCESLGPSEATESREVAKEITHKMKEYTNGNCKDELFFSASSNGYVADESSVSRPKIEYIKEDYSYRVGSPCSVSTLSRRTSHSREPYVIKEAKRRLSERLAKVASIGTSQGQSKLSRSTSTLGEMLAIPEVTKDGGSNNLTISSRRLCGSENSSRNLTRLNSVPVISSVFENIGLREEVPDFPANKSIGSKSKSGLSIFKGKVSSFFSLKSKKAAREKPISHSFVSGHRFHSEASGEPSSKSFHHCDQPEESISVYSEEITRKVSSFNGPKHGTSSLMFCLSFERARAPENSRESQDQQPSLISVLEPPFEDDAYNNISKHPQALSRSPPIGSVSRTLTWQNPREVPNSIKLSRVLSRKCEEQERSLLIQKLLSCANLLDSGDSTTVLARWHSLDSPLDPVLLNDLLNQRLLFDCVNAALLSIGQAALMSIYPWAKAYGWARVDGRVCSQVAEEVSRLVKDWFSSEKKMFSGEADELVKEEVGGRGWDKSECLEVGEFSKEIEGKVLEELIEEALADLTIGC